MRHRSNELVSLDASFRPLCKPSNRDAPPECITP